ncbi:unnamed protein product [Psylliodes chrysocephalus]|uniref:Cytochrome P450 n=1 Tax=Psylliodes chrysocephalus TaxID=3402493 RepID=A0A9P0CU92_9CUCU|nr:unnamed protein product [Psylliodes chrysocephala]
MLLTTSASLDLFILLFALFFILHKYISRSHEYWSKRGVDTPKPLPIFGHFLKVALFKTTLAEWLKDYYDAAKGKYFGLYVFDEPFLVIKDPEIIKYITTKDFNYFMDRNIAAPSHDVLQRHILFLQKSPGWKSIRIKLTPAFTSGRLKAMFHLIDSCGQELENWISHNLGILEAKEVVAKYATNVIAKCAFGIDSECFLHEKPAFREVGRKFFDFRWRNALSQTLYFLKPSWIDKIKLDFIDKQCLEYFSKVFIETLNTRPDEEQYNDFIDILKELRKNNEFASDGSDDSKLAGIAIQIFMAGFETTSTTISFTLYEFCMNTKIQDKARNEIKTVLEKYGGKVTYEAVRDCVYLEMCMNETLRKYPVLPFLDRRCNADYKVPGTDLIIEKGTAVFIPMYGLQMDEKYFPEPFKYKPERFLNKIESTNGVTYLPFGVGPRICIGERFGRLSTKLALIYVLKKFEIEACDSSPDPVKFEPKCFLFASTVGLPLKFKLLQS